MTGQDAQIALKDLSAETIQEMLEAEMDTHQNRGVQDMLITCVDNLSGFSQAITACYPQTEIQKCIIHQIRNSTRAVSYKDLKKVTADLKPIFKAATEEAALVERDRFEEVWVANFANPKARASFRPMKR